MLSSQLPEYDTVMSLYSAGKVYCAQLIAEIDDIRRLNSSKSLVALTGINPPPNQSGAVDIKSRNISKRSSSTESYLKPNTGRSVKDCPLRNRISASGLMKLKSILKIAVSVR